MTSNNNNSSDTDKLLKVQTQANQLHYQMKVIVDKTIQRGENIDEVDNKSQSLIESAQRFQKSTTKLKWKYYCEKFRNWIIIFVILTLFLLLMLWALGVFH